MKKPSATVRFNKQSKKFVARQGREVLGEFDTESEAQAAIAPKPSLNRPVVWGKSFPSPRHENLSQIIERDLIVGATPNTMTLDDGTVFYFNDVESSVPSYVVLKNGDTQTLQAYFKDHPQWLAGIHAEMFAGGHPQTDSYRLAREIAKRKDCYELHGAYYAFDGTGYEEIDPAVYVTKHTQGIIDNDTRGLDYYYGIRAQKVDVSTKLVGNVKGQFRTMVPEVEGWGIDFSDEREELQFIVNYPSGVWLAPEDRLIEHSKDYFIRPAVNYEYTTDIDAPVFFEWLKEVLPEEDQQAVFQEMLAVTMTGDRRHQKLFNLFGPKRAGKGSTTEILKALVGRGRFQGLTGQDLSYNFGLQQMPGMLLCLVNEVKGLGAKEVGLLKAATGDDDQSIQVKFGKAILTKLTVNWVLSSNECVELEDSSGVIVSRIVPLWFRHSFFGKENPKLIEQILEELPAISAWARLGYARYLANKCSFTPNITAKPVTDALSDYTSKIAAFVNQCCDVGPDALGKKVCKTALYAAYAKHSTPTDDELKKVRNADPILTPNMFGRELRSYCHGVMPSTDKRHFTNIILKDQ